MADLLRKGSAWLHKQRNAHMASMVDYRRADGDPIAVRATASSTTYEVSDMAGATIETHTADFLVLATELGFEPEAGDVIVTEGRRFEVLRLGGGGVYRWSDPQRNTYRIHTKDIGEAEA